jgi:Tol biopolymer transport system component/DNA-binding winged helix-turn-helix (wHTH) protein
MTGDFRLDKWLVQPQLNSVSSGDEVIRLEPKVMQVLVQLASHPDEVLTKGQLIDSVWPDTHVGEQVLTRCISELRRVFGEDAKMPRYIQNVPRVGYRLIAPVLPPSPDPPAHARASHASPPTLAEIPQPAVREEPRILPAKLRRRRLWRIPLWAAVVLTLVGIAVVALVHRNNSRDITLMTVPLTSYPGSQTQASFSPDGREVAFVWNQRGDASNIFVKLIDSESPLQLTSSKGLDQSPAWSPDGGTVAFIRYVDGADGIYLVPATGSSERRIYQLHREIDGDAPGLSWSPDGDWLVFPDSRSAEDPSAIYALSLKSLEAKQLSFPMNSWDGDYNPVFSPDGKKIAFVRGADAGARNLYVMNADGSNCAKLTSKGRTVSGLTWTRDGSEIVFSSDIGGGLSLWRIRSGGGTPRRLSVGGDNAVYPTISQHSDRLAYSQGSAKWSIMRVDLTALTKQPQQLFSSMEKDSAAQYSPDESLIAFQSLRSGTQEIWMSKSDGDGPVKLTSFNGPLTGSPNWSPDGNRIAFDSRSSGRSHIYVMTSEGGNPQPLTEGEYNDVVPSWSQDGAWVYFASRRSGRWEVWKTSPQTREIRQVTNTGAFIAKESLDGQWLYYTKYHQSGLWRRALVAGSESKVLGGPPSAFWGYWSLTTSGVYYLDYTGANAALKFWSFSDSKISDISVLPHRPPPFAGVAASRSGHWLLYSEGGDLGQNIRMVENFR